MVGLRSGENIEKGVEQNILKTVEHWTYLLYEAFRFRREKHFCSSSTVYAATVVQRLRYTNSNLLIKVAYMISYLGDCHYNCFFQNRNYINISQIFHLDQFEFGRSICSSLLVMSISSFARLPRSVDILILYLLTIFYIISYLVDELMHLSINLFI